MSDFSTGDQMMVQAYGMYLMQEKDLNFSTRDKYKRRLQNYLSNPDRTKVVAPPYFVEAVEKIQEYTS